MRWKARTAHKWMAMLVGVIMLLWLVSGILMVLPQFPDAPKGLVHRPNVDWRTVDISPPAAILSLEQSLGRSIDVRKIELIQVMGKVFYKVTLNKNGFYLVDGKNGQVSTFNPQMAEALLQQRFASPVSIKEKHRLDEHTLDYLWGPLPAMRFILDDPSGTIVYVSLQSGGVRWSSALTSFRGVLESFHTFDTVKLFTSRKEVSRIALIFFSLVGIGVVLTGGFLAIKPMR